MTDINYDILYRMTRESAIRNNLPPKIRDAGIIIPNNSPYSKLPQKIRDAETSKDFWKAVYEPNQMPPDFVEAQITVLNHGEESFKTCPLPRCGMKLNTSIQKHIGLLHLNFYEKCPKCDGSFTYNYNFNCFQQHFKNMHTTVPLLQMKEVEEEDEEKGDQQQEQQDNEEELESPIPVQQYKKPTHVTCAFCNKLLKSKRNHYAKCLIKNKIIERNSDTITWKCIICELDWKSLLSVVRHVITTENDHISKFIKQKVIHAQNASQNKVAA